MPSRSLPPGQRRLDHFPRFGTGLGAPPPDVPPDPVITIAGAVVEPFDLTVAALIELPRDELLADFHCVAGWSATDLRWEGVPFHALYRERIEPVRRPGAAITHVVFEGLDGYQCAVEVDDAMTDRFLIADHLDGAPLGPDHGAPARVVSPDQYGYKSIKHLRRIELRTEAPRDLRYGGGRNRLAMLLLQPHPRARVQEEERHRYVPGRLLRRVYWRTVRSIARADATPP
jgi:DMSO/TMAO reductase YedYZ molybdopterin-dependent catalytic subunit